MTARQVPLPPSGYGTIVADPPWEIGDFPPNFGYESGKSRPYDCMTTQQICDLPVAEWAAANCHLYLWTITDHLQNAYKVAAAWGFDVSSVLVWCKPRYGSGLGGTWPADVEFVLYCRQRGGQRVVAFTKMLRERAAELGVTRKQINAHMGVSDMAGWWLSDLSRRASVPTVEQWDRLKGLLRYGDEFDAEIKALNGGASLGRAPGRWHEWPRGPHSQKPDAFMDMVETVSPGPYLEMFSRRARLGWDTWGNESLGGGEAVVA